MRALIFIPLLACGGAIGGPLKGAADTHCANVAAQPVNAAVCGGSATPIATGAANSDYGDTHDGTVADDDDCKYHVSWASTPLQENTNVTFTIQANELAGTQAKVTGLDTTNGYAEVFLTDTHPGPPTAQRVTTTAPGTITFGPVEFDKKGVWTVRFHFFELCSDEDQASPHGHTAFYVEVP